jgi:hypothetical protein
MASTADKATAARVLHDAGQSAEDIADLLHAGLSTVYRWLKDNPTPANGSAVEDLDNLLAGQDLDDNAQFLAGVAKRLAQRLDSVAVSTKAQDAMAMPQIAKELRAVVAEIMGASQDDKEWLAGLFTQMGDPEDAGTSDARVAGS